MKLCNNNKCTACGACVNVCPKNAIAFFNDKYGFAYPQINKELCIDCGLCSKVCPSLNSVNGVYPQKAYAVWSNNEEDRRTSTSGGAASVFYQYVLKNNGICYGATYDEKFNVVIKGYDDQQVINFKNSKYVQSNMQNSYSDIKKHLSEKRQVIFIGLPCQVAGLRSFLGKEYDNLLLVDIICHGTPPQEYLSSHISYLEKKYKKKSVSVKFRSDNEFYFMLFDRNSNKPFANIHKNIDTYLISFFNSLTYKEVCYECKYASNDRISDITIGDFWGLGSEKPFNHPYTGAISLVLTNTQKGMNFFDKVKDRCFFEERPIEEAIKGNDQLNSPSTKDVNRTKFLELYVKEGFEKAVNDVYYEQIKNNKKTVRKYEINKKLRSAARKILRR